MIARRETAFGYAVLVAGSIAAVFPLLYVLLTALTPIGEAGPSFRWPSELDFQNLAIAWRQGRFAQYMRSSLIVTTSVVVLGGVLSILAGFAFARLSFRGSGAAFAVFLVGLLVPLEGYIIPLYFTMRSYGLLDTYASLILPQVAQTVAFGTFWMRNYFRRIPMSLIEAARLDGARDMRVLWTILVPMARPAIVTMVILTFMWTWNDFLLSLVMISSESHRTAPLALTFFQAQYTVEYATLSAASLIVALPVVLLFVFLRRYFLEGMLGGALRD
ncbi:MAG: carbohydrate ABC transporter permease [Microbacteriaceae bacterium]